MLVLLKSNLMIYRNPTAITIIVSSMTWLRLVLILESTCCYWMALKMPLILLILMLLVCILMVILVLIMPIIYMLVGIGYIIMRRSWLIMAMRKRLPIKKSKKIFTKGAVKTPKLNTARPMRGGFRI